MTEPDLRGTAVPVAAELESRDSPNFLDAWPRCLAPLPGPVAWRAATGRVAEVHERVKTPHGTVDSVENR